MRRRRAEERRCARAVGHRLATVSEPDPRSIRRRVLKAILQLVEADGAVFYTLGVADGRRYATRWETVGPESISQCLRNFSGPRGRTAVNDARLSDYARPSRLEATAFVEDVVLWEPEVFLESFLYKEVLAPFGLRHQQRLLAYQGRQFLGWVGLLRGRGTPPFSLVDRQRLQPLVQPVITALLTAERLETAAQPEEAGDIVVSADGRVLHASRPGRAWLEQPGFTLGMTKAVRVLDGEREDRQASAALGGNAWARIVRLDGLEGVRYLVHTKPLEALTMHPDTPLSSRQRQVAYSIAAGATIRETADALGLSAETVRTHLRAIYLRLGVANRLELANALLAPEDLESPLQSPRSPHLKLGG